MFNLTFNKKRRIFIKKKKKWDNFFYFFYYFKNVGFVKIKKKLNTKKSVSEELNIKILKTMGLPIEIKYKDLGYFYKKEYKKFRKIFELKNIKSSERLSEPEYNIFFSSFVYQKNNIEETINFFKSFNEKK